MNARGSEEDLAGMQGSQGLVMSARQPSCSGRGRQHCLAQLYLHNFPLWCVCLLTE